VYDSRYWITERMNDSWDTFENPDPYRPHAPSSARGGASFALALLVSLLYVL
jgi:hypothetical protein